MIGNVNRDAQRASAERAREGQLVKLAAMYAGPAEEEHRRRVASGREPGDRDRERDLHLARKTTYQIRASAFRLAGLDIRNKTPDMYLRHVVWRVAAAEEAAQRLTKNVPLATSMPATMLVHLGVDVTPDKAWELTRKNGSATAALLSAVESQFDA